MEGEGRRFDIALVSSPSTSQLNPLRRGTVVQGSTSMWHPISATPSPLPAQPSPPLLVAFSTPCCKPRCSFPFSAPPWTPLGLPLAVRGGSLLRRSSATHWVDSQIPVSPGGQSQMYLTLPTAPTKHQMDISVQTVSQRGWRDMVLSTVLLLLPLSVFSALRRLKKHHNSFSSDGSQQFLKSFTETPKNWCYFLFNRREEPAGEGEPFCFF